MTITERMASLCADGLPARVGESEIAQARLCLIDSLAVAYAAADEAPIRMVWETVGAGEGPAEATVIGPRGRCRADTAALINGTMVSLLLYDDNHSEMRGHPSGPVIPVALALGEARDASLAEALGAFAVGYEVEVRLGMVLNPSQYEVGWHATATQGTFGAAAAAGVLLGLDAGAMARAFGIAGSMAGGLRRNFGTMTMSFHSGLAAEAGIRAARLAAAGFTATPDVFDGEMSIGHALSREWDPAHLEAGLDRWGRPFAIVDSGSIFKLFPTGRPTLSPIECALALGERDGVRAGDVRRIVCDVSFMYPRTLIHANPRTGLEGKTSLQYCVAAALLDGRPTLATYTDAAVSRPAIAALIDRIEVRVPPELGEDVADVRRRPFEQPVTVTVETADGCTFSRTVRNHKGTRANPVTEADLLGKFVDCTRGRFEAAMAGTVAAYVGRADSTVRGLFALLGGGRA